MEDLAHEGTTMIVVTHEMHFAREAADRVIFMEDGVICEQGPPEQMLDAPQMEGTKRFLRRFLESRSRRGGILSVLHRETLCRNPSLDSCRSCTGRPLRRFAACTQLAPRARTR